MRMSKSLFLLMALAVGSAFAADGVVISRAIPGNLTNSGAGNDTVSRTTSGRGTVSRTTASSSRGTSGGRTTASRTTSSRATTTRAGTGASRGTATRSAANASGGVTTRATGDINSNPAVRRAGVVLRPSFADYGGRATIAGTNQQTGSNIRNDIQKISGRATKITQATKESIADAREKLELTAELNKSCQEQYNECMDQFCAIVDANQKRCSCSANLAKYAKVEKAATEANAKLNEVAQAIRYVGLSADEIRAIMTETEAEEALDDTKDTSTTRNMLKQIESMIKDPTSRTSTYYSSDSDFGLDMDLSFSSEPLDIFNLDILNIGTNNSSSISNLRGADLYNVAKRRCSTILNRCNDAGATQTQITGNYDLAIDKDCISYEAGLKKMNETLLSNVKSANLMLQKARLAVLENKNQYDAKGCVAALDTCMRDDMVCGDDYYKCVDPTKSYIDENGQVVLGQDITVIQSFMTNYNNAAIDKTFLSNANGVTISKDSCTDDGKCVAKYILQKIGTGARATDNGLCRPVLDKCQRYTYTDKTYQPYNDIVVNYVQRAMVNVRAAQQKIISDYASSCIADVASCYNSQITQVNSWTSAASVSNIYSVMRGACRSVALTCGFALFTGEPLIESHTELDVGGKKYHVDDCPAAAAEQYGTAAYNDGIINCVSNMFYQSLLCPDNSTYVGEVEADQNGTTGGNVNTRCQCDLGFDVWSGSCLASCPDGATRNSNGTCVCDSRFTYKNGLCYDGDEPVSGGTSVYSCSTNYDNSTRKKACTSVSPDGTVGGCIDENNNCACKTDYMNVNGSCVSKCPANSTYSANCSGDDCVNDYCKCKANYKLSGSSCVSNTQPASDTTYTVTYSCGEGTGQTPTAQTYISAGSSVTLSDNTCTAPSGKRFYRWSCGVAGGSYTVNSNVTCTAQWTNQGNYVVTFFCNDDYSDVFSQRYGGTSGSTFWVPGQGSCQGKNGATFQGKWQCTDSKTYNTSDTFTIGNTDVNCTAVWSGDAYVNYVRFNCNGGTGGPTALSTANGGSVTLPQGTECTYTGHTFTGWLCDGVAYDSGADYTPSSDTECTAQWDDPDPDEPATPTDTGLSLNFKNSNSSYALWETNDGICLLYSLDENGVVDEFIAIADCNLDLNSLSSE